MSEHELEAAILRIFRRMRRGWMILTFLSPVAGCVVGMIGGSWFVRSQVLTTEATCARIEKKLDAHELDARVQDLVMADIHGTIRADGNRISLLEQRIFAARTAVP
jgi:hypothetical protein